MGAGEDKGREVGRLDRRGSPLSENKKEPRPARRYVGQRRSLWLRPAEGEFQFC